MNSRFHDKLAYRKGARIPNHGDDTAAKDLENPKASRAQLNLNSGHVPKLQSSQPHTPSPVTARASWDPQAVNDVTMRLSLDLEEDLERLLEDFCRLKRLGRFKLAKQYFQDHLAKHLSEPQVVVEWTDLFIRMGDYKGLGDLLDASELQFPKLLDDSQLSATVALEYRMLQCNWELLIALHDIHDHCDLHNVEDAKTRTFDLLDSRPEPGGDSNELGVISSAEAQVLALLAQVSTYIDHSSYQRFRYQWTGQPNLYRQLLLGEQIWDFVDVFEAFWYAEYPGPGCNLLLGEEFEPPHACYRKIWADWSTDAQDSTTNLALLQILGSLARSLCDHNRLLTPNERSTLNGIIQQGRQIALSLKDQDKSVLKTRPYLRWILSETVAENYQILSDSGKCLFDHLDAFPGIRTKVDLLGLPIYIPLSSENPGWHKVSFPNNFEEELQLILQHAHDLEDHITEAQCLAELICQSNAPREHFENLLALEMKVRNRTRAGETVLAKYLITDRESWPQYMDELGSTAPALTTIAIQISGITGESSPLHEWMLAVMVQTVAAGRHEINAAPGLVAALESRLPQWLQDDIYKLNYLGRRNSRRGETESYSGSEADSDTAETRTSEVTGHMDVDHLTTEIDRLKEELRRASDLNRTHLSSLEVLREENGKLNAELRHRLREDVNRLNAQVLKAEKKAEAARSTESSQSATIRRLEKENDALSKRQAELNTKVADLGEGEKKFAEKSQTLATDLQTALQEKDKLTEEVKRLSGRTQASGAKEM